MMNYLKKFALEILPSVAATVIGAYIVNHYISKPATDSPVAAAISSVTGKKTAAKPADGSADGVTAPEPGVKAKGISERGMMEKSASERPGEFKPAEKSADIKPAEIKPADTASLPADTRRHTPAPKAVAKTTPSPAVAAPTPPVEAAAAPAADDHRDANDLARAAIERLRGSDGQPRTQEASRAPEISRAPVAPRLQEAPQTVAAPAATAIRPLPPPITVSAPPVETPVPVAPYTASVDPSRPTPPAEIPPPPPIDLRADASKLATRTNNVAQDMFAATKSMFHSLIPNSNDKSGQSSSSAGQFTD